MALVSGPASGADLTLQGAIGTEDAVLALQPHGRDRRVSRHPQLRLCGRHDLDRHGGTAVHRFRSARVARSRCFFTERGRAEPVRTVRGLAVTLEAGVPAPLALVLLFSTCAFPNPWIKPVLKANPARTFFYEQDFVADPTLVALPNQVAVLTLLPASGTSPSLQQHKVRYQLSSGAYNFCLKGDPSLTTMTVTDPSGQVVVNVNMNACSTIDLPTNTYGISIWHDPAKVAGKPRIIFVQLPAPHVKTINADGTPRGGYWALQPDPAQDPTGAGRVGRLHALPQQNMVPPDSGTSERCARGGGRLAREGS
ncbi:MAG: hypothetical protein ACJ73N_04255 [Bryobacteraceae bacterium]